MLVYPEINPVMINLGFLQVHWYGFMYILSFVVGLFLAKRQYRNDEFWNFDRIADFTVFVAFGTILGGRIGYVLFYSFSDFIANPLILFKIWEGGMSFHGGIIGVTLAFFLYSKKTHIVARIKIQNKSKKRKNKDELQTVEVKKSFLEIADFAAPFIPIGLFFGRIGNFINGELWGKVTDSPFGMLVYDPILQKTVAKYPTQLLEAFLEGLVLFLILRFYQTKKPPVGSIAAMFVLIYAVFRFLVEYIRTPDAHLGYLAFGWVTMGQILSIPMFVIGIGFLIYFYKNTIKK